jgi:hypothetical protein
VLTLTTAPCTHPSPLETTQELTNLYVSSGTGAPLTAGTAIGQYQISPPFPVLSVVPNSGGGLNYKFTFSYNHAVNTGLLLVRRGNTPDVQTVVRYVSHRATALQDRQDNLDDCSPTTCASWHYLSSSHQFRYTNRAMRTTCTFPPTRSSSPSTPNTSWPSSAVGCRIVWPSRSSRPHLPPHPPAPAPTRWVESDDHSMSLRRADRTYRPLWPERRACTRHHEDGSERR